MANETRPPDRILGVIPARMQATRLPGKPLLDVGGKTLIQRVYERAVQCRSFHRIVIATPDAEIEAEALRFGAEVMRTRGDHPNGTSRCLEVWSRFSQEPDALVNIQGDEPLISPEHLEIICQALKTNPSGVHTLKTSIQNREEWINPATVKVVARLNGEALYFSRAPIPFTFDAKHAWRHVGVYGFSKEALRQISGFGPTGLEQAENLEQIRWMQHGLNVYLHPVSQASISVDTLADLEEVRRQIERIV